MISVLGLTGTASERHQYSSRGELFLYWFDRIFRRSVCDLLRRKDIRGLLRVLNTGDRHVRREALEALSELGKSDPTVVHALRQQLATLHWTKRRAIIRVLGQIGRRSGLMEGLLNECLRDRSSVVRHESMSALAKMDDDGVQRLLTTELSDLDDLLNRAAVLANIGHYRKAIDDVDLAIEAKGWQPRVPPDQSWVLCFRGLLKREAGILDGAIEDLSAAIRGYDVLRRKAPPILWSIPIQPYVIPGNIMEVIRNIKAMVGIKRFNFVKGLVYFQRGLCFLRSRDMGRGKRDLERAVDHLGPGFRQQVDQVLGECKESLRHDKS